MTRSLILIATLVLLTSSVLAGIPDTFENLTVFPKDMGKRELIDVMRDFSTALGVRCTFCHVIKTPGDYDTIDWASDELSHKKVTRGMMGLVGEINGGLLEKAGKGDHSVSCITCHRGLADPSTLDKVLEKTIAANGLDAGLAKYRELRDSYYGNGSYDFGIQTLAGVAEYQAQTNGDVPGALALCDLNVEMNPDNADALLMRAQINMMTGDAKAARADVTKALEIDPEHGHAQSMLQQLGG